MFNLGYWNLMPRSRTERTKPKKENSSPYQANESAEKKTQTDSSQNIPSFLFFPGWKYNRNQIITEMRATFTPGDWL